MFTSPPFSGLRRRLRTATTAVVLACAVSAPTSAGTAQAAPQHVWEDLAACESSGNWRANTGNGFYGGLQFTPSTWRGHGGTRFAPRADLASPAEQISVAKRVLRHQGWGAWPVCSRRLAPKARATARGPVPAVPHAPAARRTYRVQPGDTLNGIATAHRVPGGWHALYGTNLDTIAHPDVIYPGQVLRLT
ncbi:transglycosylase family protein [Streptomyces formicae]|uniref:LysM peptidoglycan-binding domain-containing protein n=1 Tax=Streptomyces formicae TaxID=1616117 RepID=UPI002412A1C7|nr:transglycosylase family protein [Streptomyces formicae]